jgi:pilus assembly protein Flp/PilA
MEKLVRFIKDEEGVTAVEYGLIAALIALVIIVAVALLGTKLRLPSVMLQAMLPPGSGGS